ncbi:hypothetical protein KJ603_00620 [Patescibacteria group bacterium]|nr:hypothetical protein [Patescibacteria group bacterium]
MIGKSKWFKRRKYSGWGLTPATWQGWAYIGVFLIPVIIVQNLPFLADKTKTILTSFWSLILVFDVIAMMMTLKTDERDKLHEALSERNALWGIIAVLALAIIYQAITTGIFDWWIMGALFTGVIIKSISNIYLDKKN